MNMGFIGLTTALRSNHDTTNSEMSKLTLRLVESGLRVEVVSLDSVVLLPHLTQRIALVV